MNELIHIKTVSDVHKIVYIEKPKHPLVSVFYHNNKRLRVKYQGNRFVSDLYSISLRISRESSMGYGRSSYDFDEGTLVFTKPGQVTAPQDINFKKLNRDMEGWSLTFHPDLLRKSILANKMDSYTFFSYDVNEALHLSDDERKSLTELVRKVDKETQQNIDAHSQVIITSCIELILNFCNRFYDRQFFTRTNMNIGVIAKFEKFLKEYFNSERPVETGIPSVSFCGKELHMSGHYLSDLLKKETGKTAQEHIHYYVINQAKNKLMNSDLSVSQIAYNLGFDYPQHFSKIFKAKTGMSPSSYRKVILYPIS